MQPIEGYTVAVEVRDGSIVLYRHVVLKMN